MFSELTTFTRVPVVLSSIARWGFGGGAGHRKDEDGAGGGGGVQVTPVGFIEIKNGEAEFRHQNSFTFVDDCRRYLDLFLLKRYNNSLGA